MKFEFKHIAPFEKKDGKKIERDPEIQWIEKDLEKAEDGFKLWKDSYDAVMFDLAKIEADEGPLDPHDPRLTAPKICAMRLDEQRRLLKALKDEMRGAAKHLLN